MTDQTSPPLVGVGHAPAPETVTASSKALRPSRPLVVDLNCSMAFLHLPIALQLAKARSAGFAAVELWWPFDSPAPDYREVADFVRAITKSGLRLVCMNTAGGDFTCGWRGLASLPDHSEVFRANIDLATRLAEDLGTGLLNVLYGNSVPGLPPEGQRGQAISSLRYAAESAAGRGQTILVEALNGHDLFDYSTHSSADVRSLLEPIWAEGLGNLALLADIYHLATGGEDVLDLPTRGAVGHVQVADVPGRGQPGTDKLPFYELLSAHIGSGYGGLVGCEYAVDGGGAADWVAGIDGLVALR